MLRLFDSQISIQIASSSGWTELEIRQAIESADTRDIRTAIVYRMVVFDL